MLKLKKIITLGAIVLSIAAISIIANADSGYSTPAEAAAGLTGKTVDSIIVEKFEGNKTYGAIANEAGKLAEFKAEILKMKKDALAKKVADGTITQEKANEIIAALEQNQANCDGTGVGEGRIGQNNGAGFGRSEGKGQGRGFGQGRCLGQGRASF